MSSLRSATDPGAPFQLGDSGPAVKYSSPEDSATPPPGHSLLCPGGNPGHAGEEGVRQRHRSHAPHHHRQSQGHDPPLRLWRLCFPFFLKKKLTFYYFVLPAKEAGLHSIQPPQEEETGGFCGLHLSNRHWSCGGERRFFSALHSSQRPQLHLKQTGRETGGGRNRSSNWLQTVKSSLARRDVPSLTVF